MKLPAGQRRLLLGEVLRDTSRSFYLTLRVLPRAIRAEVGTAYLLARAADTIADTQAIPREKRLAHLHLLQHQFDRKPIPAEIMSIQRDVVAHRVPEAEARLLHSLVKCFALYQSFEPPNRRLIAEVVMTLMRGMESDIRRFPQSHPQTVHALHSEAELDEYIYLVAGCVGKFWTQMCVGHLPALRDWNVAAMIEKGIRFGKGLQLTNILRDIPRDLRNGRCYLPAPRLREAGLQPQDLLRPETSARVRPLLDEYLDRALLHLDVGWDYTMSIPPRLLHLRLACIWPIWIGLQTLAQLRRTQNLLDPAVTVKITRPDIYRIMASSAALTWSGRALTRRYEELRGHAMRG